MSSRVSLICNLILFAPVRFSESEILVFFFYMEEIKINIQAENFPTSTLSAALKNIMFILTIRARNATKMSSKSALLTSKPPKKAADVNFFYAH